MIKELIGKNFPAQKILIYLYVREEKEVILPYRKFAEVMNVSVGTLTKYLGELEKENLIEVERNGKKTVYKVRKEQSNEKRRFKRTILHRKGELQEYRTQGRVRGRG